MEKDSSDPRMLSGLIGEEMQFAKISSQSNKRPLKFPNVVICIIAYKKVKILQSSIVHISMGTGSNDMYYGIICH